MRDLITEGVKLAAFGMGTVFFLLTLLVIAIFIMERILRTNAKESGDSVYQPSKHLILKAVSAAAIHHYRKKSNERIHT